MNTPKCTGRSNCPKHTPQLQSCWRFDHELAGMIVSIPSACISGCVMVACMAPELAKGRILASLVIILLTPLLVVLTCLRKNP